MNALTALMIGLGMFGIIFCLAITVLCATPRAAQLNALQAQQSFKDGALGLILSCAWTIAWLITRMLSQ